MALFSRNKNEENVAQPTTSQLAAAEEMNYDGTTRPRPEVREEDFIDTSDPNKPPQQTETQTIPSEKRTVVEYTLGMPIDGVYMYMEKDWEESGRQDAANNPDMTYMETKVEIIKQGLQRRFELTRLKYNKMIREYTSRVDTLNQFGLSGTMTELEAHIETCKEHLQKLNELEDKFHKDDPALQSMTKSYRRGFTLGVAMKAQDSIKDNSYGI